MKRILLLVVALLLVPTLVKADESIFEDMTDEEKIEELIRIVIDLEQRIEELENGELVEDEEEINDEDTEKTNVDTGDKGSFKNPFNIDDTGEFIIDREGSTASISINNVIIGSEATNHIENGYSDRDDRYDTPEGHVPVVIDLTLKITSLNDAETYKVAEIDFTSTLENGSEIPTRPVDIDIWTNSYNLMEGASQNFEVSLFVPEEGSYFLKFNPWEYKSQVFFKMDNLD